MRTLIAVALGAILCGAAPSSLLSVTQLCGKAPTGDACIKAGPMEADFDGDGVVDSVMLMSTRAGGHLVSRSPDLTVISTLWGDRQSSGKRNGMLVVRLHKDHKAFFLIDTSGYFDTPIWHGEDLPISVAKRGSKTFNEFHAQEKRIQHDIVVLGTEAGIDTALYWNGKTFALFEPIEEP